MFAGHSSTARDGIGSRQMMVASETFQAIDPARTTSCRYAKAEPVSASAPGWRRFAGPPGGASNFRVVGYGGLVF